MLQRIRELSVEAANSTLGQTDAQSVNTEITALRAEINRTARHDHVQRPEPPDRRPQRLPESAGSSATVGTAAGGTGTTVAAVNVSGAKASTPTP